MGSQQNLASRSEVVSIYKMPPQKKFGSPPQNFVAQKRKNVDHFSATSALDTACLRNDPTNKNASVNLQ